MRRGQMAGADGNALASPAVERWTALYVSMLYRNKKLKSYQDGFVKFEPQSRRVSLAGSSFEDVWVTWHI
jgi:hypothetical protein